MKSRFDEILGIQGVNALKSSTPTTRISTQQRSIMSVPKLPEMLEKISHRNLKDGGIRSYR